MKRPSLTLVHVANNPHATLDSRRVALEMEQRRGKTLEEISQPGDEVRTVIYPDNAPEFEEIYVVEDWFGSFELTYVGVYEL